MLEEYDRVRQFMLNTSSSVAGANFFKMNPVAFQHPSAPQSKIMMASVSNDPESQKFLCRNV